MTKGAVACLTSEVLDELRQPLKDLRDRIPRVFEGNGALDDAVFTDGALDTTTKELIALAIAWPKHCDGRMALHARGAARRGATPEEVPRTFEAFEEFSKR